MAILRAKDCRNCALLEFRAQNCWIDLLAWFKIDQRKAFRRLECLKHFSKPTALALPIGLAGLVTVIATKAQSFPSDDYREALCLFSLRGATSKS